MILNVSITPKLLGKLVIWLEMDWLLCRLSVSHVTVFEKEGFGRIYIDLLY